MRIAISAESTIDLNQELLKEYDIHFIPFPIMIGDQMKFDGEVTSKEICEFMELTGTVARTAALNPKEYENYFEALLKDYDRIIHFSISSGISSTYEHAENGAKKFQGKVAIIDTRSLSTGEATLAIYAKRLLDKGTPFEEVINIVKERSHKVCTTFCFENVNYLHKSGRCSSVTAFGANLLKIRPQIVMNAEGKLESHKKFKGPVRKWVMDYVKSTLEEFNNPDHEVVFITESAIPKEVVQELTDYLYGVGFKKVYHTNPMATVTCYVGRNVLGILYINDGDHPIQA